MDNKMYEAPDCEGYRYYEDRRSRGKSVRLVRDAE